MKMVIDAIRSIFWAITKLFLVASDWIYDMLNAVVNLNLANSNVIFYSWGFMLVFLTFACIFRVSFVMLHKVADDSESIDYGKLGKKIGGMFLTVALSTTFFTFSLGLPSEIVRIYNNAITYDERMIPSTAVISSTAKTTLSGNLNDMSESDEVVSVETIDEKLNDEENGNYIYFIGLSELLLCGAGAFFVMCVQMNILTDTILRLFLNIFRFIIGFIPISSMVEDNSTCGDWVRDIISDTFIMAFMVIGTNVVFGLMSVAPINQLNGIVRIAVFIVGLMAVYKSAEFIAKYLRASNLSSGGRVGSMVMMGGVYGAIHGAGHILRDAGKYIGKGKNNYERSHNGKFGQPTDPKTGKATGWSSFLSGNGGRGGKSGGLGAGVSASASVNPYFAGSGAGAGTIASGISSLGGADESVLDKTPTSPETGYSGMSTDSGGETTYYSSGASAPTGGSDSLGETAGEVSGGTDGKMYFSGDEPISKAFHDDLIRQGYSEHDIDSGVWKKQTQGKGKYATLNGEKINMGRGTAFVDTPTSGHVYKKSKTVYKQSKSERTRKILTDKPSRKSSETKPIKPRNINYDTHSRKKRKGDEQ